MLSLIAATLLFLGVHGIVSGTALRDVIAARVGEWPFKLGFSLVITMSLVWMGVAWSRAPTLATWGTAQALKPVAWILMLPAFVLLACGLTERNPTTLGLVPPDQVVAHGIVRITRHPGLIGLGLWGLAHFIVNGDWASHLLFGSFAFQGLIAPLNLDRKYRRRYGPAWESFARQTSYLPFLAILQKRNRLVLGEIHWLAVLVACGLFVLVLHYHQAWFGASPY